MSEILLTGANGFLGTEIVRQALAGKLDVCATDRGPMSTVSGVDYFSADILDPESLNQHPGKFSTIVHAAGLAHIFNGSEAKTAPFRDINETGTANVARFAAQSGIQHFILISSVSVYGLSAHNVLDENSPCHPQGQYAESKYQAEQRAIEMAKASGMALSILRLATLFGEGDPGNVARLMRSIDQRRFVWIGNGSNRKNLLHREDAARACLLAVQQPAKGVKIYNVSGPPCTMGEIVDGLASVLGKPIPPFGIPGSLVRGISAFLSGFPISKWQNFGALAQKWLSDDVFDGSKFAQAFHFQPRVSLTEGLRREGAWYQAEQAKRGA